MGSILVVTLMLTGDPSFEPRRLNTVSTSCEFERATVAGMNRAEAESGSNVRYMLYCTPQTF
jgi:hypothetical protein